MTFVKCSLIVPNGFAWNWGCAKTKPKSLRPLWSILFRSNTVSWCFSGSVWFSCRSSSLEYSGSEDRSSCSEIPAFGFIHDDFFASCNSTTSEKLQGNSQRTSEIGKTRRKRGKNKNKNKDFRVKADWGSPEATETNTQDTRKYWNTWNTRQSVDFSSANYVLSIKVSLFVFNLSFFVVFFSTWVAGVLSVVAPLVSTVLAFLLLLPILDSIHWPLLYTGTHKKNVSAPLSFSMLMRVCVRSRYSVIPVKNLFRLTPSCNCGCNAENKKPHLQCQWALLVSRIIAAFRRR